MATPSSSRHNVTCRTALSLSTSSIRSYSFCSGSDAATVMPAFLIASKISRGPVVGATVWPPMFVFRGLNCELDPDIIGPRTFENEHRPPARTARDRTDDRCYAQMHSC